MQQTGNSVLAVLYLVVVQIAQVVHKSVEMTARVILKRLLETHVAVIAWQVAIKEVEIQHHRRAVVTSLVQVEMTVVEVLDVKAAAVPVTLDAVVLVVVIVHHVVGIVQLAALMIVMVSAKELALMPVQVDVVHVTVVPALVETQHAR